MQNEGTLEGQSIDDNANQSQGRSAVLHKVPCSLIHVNFTRGEKSDLLKHNAFAKSITALSFPLACILWVLKLPVSIQNPFWFIFFELLHFDSALY